MTLFDDYNCHGYSSLHNDHDLLDRLNHLVIMGNCVGRDILLMITTSLLKLTTGHMTDYHVICILQVVVKCTYGVFIDS